MDQPDVAEVGQAAPDPAARPAPATGSSRDDLVRVALRFLPYLLLFATVALGAAIGGQRVTNPDTYFHLRYGDEFWGRWSPWSPGSVTPFATRDWLPTQWLSEIVMGRFEAVLGLPGVAWLTGLWCVGYVLALFLVCRRWSGALVASFMTLLAVLGSTNALSGRPQVLSYVLVTVVVGAWIATAEDGRPRWWLLAVAWVWPLLHGMWLLGLVTSFVGAFGVLVDRRRELEPRAALRLVGLPVAMAVLSGLSLIGPGLYGAVAEVGSRGAYFTEWGPAKYTDPAPLCVALLFVVLIVATMRLGVASWFVVAMTALVFGWAIYSLRTVPVAAATAAPLAAYVLGQRFGTEPGRLRLDRRVAAGLVAVALVALAVVVPFSAQDQRSYPAWVRTELDRLPRGTPVLSSDYDGSYLMWAHPQVAVVAHGYGDSFTDEELARNSDLFNLAPGWQDDLRALKVKVAVLPSESALADALRTTLRWTIRHESDDFVYLTAPPQPDLVS